MRRVIWLTIFIHGLALLACQQSDIYFEAWNFVTSTDPARFTLNANGSPGFETTTELHLDFGFDPGELELEDIVLTGATKMGLSGSGPNRILRIENITVGNCGVLTLSFKNFLDSSGSILSRNVTVFINLFGAISYRNLIHVPGGNFTQRDTDSHQFSHTISDFELGAYQVSYQLWRVVYAWATNNGFYFANPGKEGSDGSDGAEPTDREFEPVTAISWRDAIVWCNAYSQMTGLNPVYYADSGLSVPLTDSRDGDLAIDSEPGSFDNPFVNWGTSGYRLPTEGEWQYAASYVDGASWLEPHEFSGSSVNTQVNDLAWYFNNSNSKTQDIGGKLPNALEIFDMSGNVWEWCWDWDGAWPDGSLKDYRGPGSGASRVIRGGSHNGLSENLQVGHRCASSSFTRNYYSGFRLARSRN